MTLASRVKKGGDLSERVDELDKLARSAIYSINDFMEPHIEKLVGPEEAPPNFETDVLYSYREPCLHQYGCILIGNTRTLMSWRFCWQNEWIDSCCFPRVP